MNKNKKNKNVKQNKAISKVVEKTMDVSGTKTALHNSITDKSK